MSTGVCRWLFLLISLSTWIICTSSKEIRVVCYYTNWSVYRPGSAKFSPPNINPYLCTHLIYAFGGFTKENTLKPFDKYQDIEKGGYAKFTGLKTYNKNLKTMIAIGGWNEGSSRFSPMVANPEKRKQFVKNSVKFLRQNHFDGLDLDWEYPSFRDGGKPRDRDNYAQLVQELREEFERESEKTGRPRLLLTMAVPAGIEYVNKGYDVPKLMKYLDWMNILSYDYHSAFEPSVNHHAPLYSLEEDSEYNYDGELNIDYTIKHYLKMGAKPEKLVLGIPTYGRSYTLFNPDAFELGAPADGPGDMGDATRENGYLAYYEICEYIKSQDWEVEQPNSDAMGPYAFKDNQWVGYDDENIIRKKAQYVAENNLGGIMYWAIDNDDFRGNCHGKPYPLIEAGKEALIEALGITDDNLISPPSKPTKPRTKPRQRIPTTKLKPITEKKESRTQTRQETTRQENTGTRRRNRIRTRTQNEVPKEPIKPRTKGRRRQATRGTTQATSTYSSLKVVTPSYTTPAPPSTPDLGGDFKCEDEGFYPHPRDCKKYFWCLSGPGELGIIAHQFTCPAGLYFNKAADSCDYARNVLCNKKLQKGTTTTTTEESKTTTSTTTSRPTTRIQSKLNTILSRRASTTTSTTPAPLEEVEYEYYDDEDEDEDEEEDQGADAEEDPRVIKELLELIKKAGGIEELEKQLNIRGGSSSTDTTTPSSLSKTLNRVLKGRVGLAAKRQSNTYTLINRNSRGPQNDGIKKEDSKDSTSSKTIDRGRPQYTTINRKRPAPVTEDDDDNNEDADNDSDDETSTRSFKRPTQPEYVTIRRGRISTSTTEYEEDDKNDSAINRNRVPGETDTEDELKNILSSRKQATRNTTPHYVNIRRQRPSTTEETTTIDNAEDSNNENDLTTPRYTVLRRGAENTGVSDSTTQNPVDSTTTLKYVTIRRGTATQASSTESSASKQEDSEAPTTLKYRIISRGTTASQDDLNTINGQINGGEVSSTPSTTSENTSVTEVDGGLQTTQPANEETTSSEKAAQLLSSTIESSTELFSTIKTPQLLQPRPFSKPLTTQSPKVSENSQFGSLDEPSDLHDDNDARTTSNKRPYTDKKTPKYTRPSFRARPAHGKLVHDQEPSTSESNDNAVNPGLNRLPAVENSEDNLYRRGNRFQRVNVNRYNEEAVTEGSTRSTLDPASRARKRYSTTESYSESQHEYEQSRSYRPDRIADLSSLTAVDFANLRGDFGNSNRRRRIRPRPSPKPTAPTTEAPVEEQEEDLRSGSRTLTLAREILSNTTFGNSRRVIPTRTKISDQINASSQVSSTKRLRQFTRTTPLSPNIESTENPNIVSSTVRRPLKPRRVVRRFRTTTKSPSTINTAGTTKSNTSEGIKPLRSLFKRPRPTASTIPTAGSTTKGTELLNLLSEKAVKTSSNNSSFETTTEVTISVTDNELTNEILNASQSEQPFKLQRRKSEDEVEDSSIEEGEQIKLSESNIRENSDLNNHNAIVEDAKGRRRIIKRVKPRIDQLYAKNSNTGKGYPDDTVREDLGEYSAPTTQQEIRRTTEANFVTVGRKVIRKFKPFETSTHSNEAGQNRKRKVIRRYRPSNNQNRPEFGARFKPRNRKRIAVEDEKPISTTEKEVLRRRFNADNGEGRRRYINRSFGKSTTFESSSTNYVTSESDDDGNITENKEVKTVLAKNQLFSMMKSEDGTDEGTTSQPETTVDYRSVFLSETLHETHTSPPIETDTEPTPTTSRYSYQGEYDNPRELTTENESENTSLVPDSEEDNEVSTIPEGRAISTEPTEETYSTVELVPTTDSVLSTLYRDETQPTSTLFDEVSEASTSEDETSSEIIADGEDIPNKNSETEVSSANFNLPDKRKYRILRPNITTRKSIEDDRDAEDEEIRSKRIRLLQLMNKAKNSDGINDGDDDNSDEGEDEASEELWEGKIKYKTITRTPVITTTEAISEPTTLEENIGTSPQGEPITPSSTIRNSILSRQKNRPAYRRPNLRTTNADTSTSSTTYRPKYKSISRGRPRYTEEESVIRSRLKYREEDTTTDQKDIAFERKFIPRGTKIKYIPTSQKTKKIQENTTVQDAIPDKNEDDEIGDDEYDDEHDEARVTDVTEEIKDIEREKTTSETTNTVNDNVETTTFYVTAQTNDDSESDKYDLSTTEGINETAETVMTTGPNYIESTTQVIPITENSLSGIPTTINSEFTTITEDEESATVTEVQSTTQYIEPEKGIDTTSISATTTPYVNDNTEEITASVLEIVSPKVRSTLRPIRLRPSYSPSAKASNTRISTEASIYLPKESKSRTTFKDRKSFSKTSESRYKNTPIKATSTRRFGAPSINRNLYRYSTTERQRYEHNRDENRDPFEDETDEDYNDGEEEYEDDDEADVEQNAREYNTIKPPTRFVPKVKNIKPSRPRISNKPKTISFKRTTPATLTDDLSDINTDAIKNRNKNLFAKKRKMNTPFAGSTTEHDPDADVTEISDANIDMITTTEQPLMEEETTDKMTTLHHIFAEDKKNMETTTYSIPVVNMNEEKVERIIEVNRIIEIHAKEDENKNATSTVESPNTVDSQPVLDKIGAINRVTVIKVVTDGNSTNRTVHNIEENEISRTFNPIENGPTTNEQTTLNSPVYVGAQGTENPEMTAAPEIASVSETTLDEINRFGFEQQFLGGGFRSSNSDRQEKKFEIYGNSKVADSNPKNSFEADKSDPSAAEIIDGISHIKVVTPRPLITEASTIALQGLFQGDTTQNANKNVPKSPTEEELLEVGGSRFVNIRLLNQDETAPADSGFRDSTRLVPIRILPNDDDTPLRARVVEVPPEDKGEIRIVPIRVEMARKRN